MLLTIPGKIIPVLTFLIVVTLGSNSKTFAAFLGSRPGFSSSFTMSFKPRIPISGVMKFSNFIWAIFSLLAINSLVFKPKAAAIFSTIGYASGCTAELSKGFFPSLILINAAAC